MTWAPHVESSKEPLISGKKPTAELRITYERENVENAFLWAFLIATFAAVIMLAGLYQYLVTMRESGEVTLTDAEVQLYATAGVIGTLIIAIILGQYLLKLLRPGNIV